MNETKYDLKPDVFAALGDGDIAYIRALSAAEARGLFPTMPDVAPDLELWALISATGEPIMLADTLEAVVENASQADLETVSLH